MNITRSFPYQFSISILQEYRYAFRKTLDALPHRKRNVNSRLVSQDYQGKTPNTKRCDSQTVLVLQIKRYIDILTFPTTEQTHDKKNINNCDYDSWFPFRSLIVVPNEQEPNRKSSDPVKIHTEGVQYIVMQIPYMTLCWRTLEEVA